MSRNLRGSTNSSTMELSSRPSWTVDLSSVADASVSLTAASSPRVSTESVHSGPEVLGDRVSGAASWIVNSGNELSWAASLKGESKSSIAAKLRVCRQFNVRIQLHRYIF